MRKLICLFLLVCVIPAWSAETKWMRLLTDIENERLSMNNYLQDIEQQLRTVRVKLLSIETSSGILEARLREREKMLGLALERQRLHLAELKVLEEQVNAKDGSYANLKKSFDDYSAGMRQKVTRLTLAVVAEGILIGGLIYALIRTAGN